MKYHEALQTLGTNFDPFLHIKPEEVVDESDNFFVIPARAPYVKDHLLVIPKRKIYIMKDMEHNEIIEMFELLESWNIKLHKKHPDVNLLLRDWLVWWNTKKSVNHLHFHLIPDCPIGAENSLNSVNRKWFDDEEYKNIAQEIKNYFW